MIIIFIGFIVEALLLIYSLISRSYQQKIRSITYISGLFAFLLYFLISNKSLNFRWYGIISLLFLAGIWAFWKLIKPAMAHSSFNPRKVITKTILNIGLVVLSMVPLLIFPEHDLIAPTGGYSVEKSQITLTDQTRLDPFTTTQAYRSVNLIIWYPEKIASLEKFPIIIFSHGGLGTITSNESLFTELASHGYVVCSIGHPSHALWTEDETGKITWVDREYFGELQREDVDKNKLQSFQYYQKWMGIRTGDISFVLDTIINQSEPRLQSMYDLIDSEKIGVIGHSLGGSAALAMPRLREDIDVVVALESPYLYDIVGVENGEFLWLQEDYPVPVLNIYSDSAWNHLSDWPQYARNAEMIAASNASIQNIHFPGAGHFSLTDLSLVSPWLARLLDGIPPDIEYRDYLQRVNQSILLFVDTFLKSNI